MRLLFLLLLCAATARANDSWGAGQGGSWQSMSGEHPHIQMVRENVRITVIRGGHYLIYADFVFHNHGPANTVMMGFPESGGGDASGFRNQSGFRNFRSWIDGRRVAIRRLPAKETEFTYKTCWVKQVRFAPRQTRRIRVSYQSPGGHSSVPTEMWVNYSFTGGNWFGEVEETNLLLEFKAPGTYLYEEGGSEKPVKPLVRRKGQRFSYRWTHWQAEGGYSFQFMKTLPNWMNYSDGWENDGRKWNTISNPEPKTLQRNSYEYHARPAAILRNGVTYVNLSQLAEKLSPRVWDDKASRWQSPEARVEWDEKLHVARLFYRKHLFEFALNSPVLEVDGKHLVRTAGKPYVATSYGDRSLYVPLRPILNVLGGDAKIDRAQHRLQLFMPRQKKG